MTDNSPQAAFQASVHGIRTVGGRKVIQIVLEAPIEFQSEIARICQHDAWVAVARIEQPMKENGEKLHRKWDELTPVTQAAIRCTEPEFWEYCGVTGEQDCAEYIRQQCKVISRSGLSMNKESAQTWALLDQGFESWKRARP